MDWDTWPIFRLAEMYLNYAEALNEYNPGHADILTYLNAVRQRVGQPSFSCWFVSRSNERQSEEKEE